MLMAKCTFNLLDRIFCMGYDIVNTVWNVVLSHMRMGHPISKWAGIRIWGRALTGASLSKPHTSESVV